ncbi:MAG: GNAT family N-acetyltransferase [Candidatus Lokiarchaeota archaeon]|nr:GNAT family N-acetyltransferase [Candidatus Lokiarchaeota archaeon]
MGVHPNYQRQVVGITLVKSMIDELLRYIPVYLETEIECNVHFYEKLLIL